MSEDNIIQLLPRPYVDASAIQAACALIDAEADKITQASVSKHGTVDILAYELCAYTSAIRRALGGMGNE